MSRSIHKSWQNTTEYKRLHKGRHGWTRRMKWYEDDLSVRLKFETPAGVFNKTYKLPQQLEEAQADYDKFRNGEAVEVWLDGHKTTTNFA
jgi:hypothetical protein